MCKLETIVGQQKQHDSTTHKLQGETAFSHEVNLFNATEQLYPDWCKAIAGAKLYVHETGTCIHFDKQTG